MRHRLQDFATACKYSKAALRHLEFVLPAVNPITGLENLLLGKVSRADTCPPLREGMSK